MSHHRVERLAEELRAAGVDAFFASSAVTMGYLHGLPEDGHERFLTLAIQANGACELICPALTENQARRAGIQTVRTWVDGDDPLGLLDDLSNRWNLRSGILAVDDTMPAAMLLRMQGVLPAALFQPGQPVLSRLMAKKDPGEIELMLRAARIADDAVQAGIDAIHPGATEIQVQAALRKAMESAGGAPTFTIVGAGAMGAEPHHETGHVVITDGDLVVMDFGCDYKGYQSDITRTVCCGKASEEAHQVYDIVLRAHHAARLAIAPGIACQDVDLAARSVIEDAGYGPRFIHRVGHGIGMRLHEEPYMAPGNDRLLEAGNCFSIEPGIYLAGKLGVRIENIVTCTENGHRSLNAEPPDVLLEV